MVNPVMLIVLPIAALSLTRLLREEKITEPVRTWIVTKTGADSMLSYLAHCHRCLSFWTAAAVTGAHMTFPHNRFVTGAIVTFAVAETAARLHEWTSRLTGGH